MENITAQDAVITGEQDDVQIIENKISLIKPRITLGFVAIVLICIIIYCIIIYYIMQYMVE